MFTPNTLVRGDKRVNVFLGLPGSRFFSFRIRSDDPYVLKIRANAFVASKISTSMLGAYSVEREKRICIGLLLSTHICSPEVLTGLTPIDFL